MLTLSIVVPIFNEAQGLDGFMIRLLEVVRQCELEYEILCVDDGSTDDSFVLLQSWRHRDPCIKLLRFTRNFGKEAAITAGLNYSSGDASVIIDADLQHPPELIPQLLQQWQAGYEVVCAIRENRDSDASWRRRASLFFYAFINMISEVAIANDQGDFRLLDARVVRSLNNLPERTRFMKGLYAWAGFRQTGVLYSVEARGNGKSKWGFRQLWNLAIDGIISFSSMPLRIWSYVGSVVAMLAFLYACVVLFEKTVFGIDVPGYATLVILILFLGGIQLISLGVIGEYLSRVYSEVKARPIYMLDQRQGFDKNNFPAQE